MAGRRGTRGLEGVPARRVDEVVHVGRLDPALRGSNWPRSHEGHCLSVSTCPFAWERIAGLGGEPWWRMRRDASLFVDVRRALRDARLAREVDAWCLARGLASRATRFVAERPTPTGRRSRRVFADGGDAARWAGATGSVAERSVLDPAPGLAEATGLHPSDLREGPLEAADRTAKLLAWVDGVRPRGPGGTVVGAWWDHRLDPLELSAPCGGILPFAVAEWAVEPVTRGAWAGGGT